MKSFQVSTDRAEPVAAIAPTSMDAVIAAIVDGAQRVEAAPLDDLYVRDSAKFRKYAALEKAANNRSDYFGGDKS